MSGKARAGKTMIRARMSFGGCFVYRRPTEEEITKRTQQIADHAAKGIKDTTNVDPDKWEHFSISLDDAIIYLEEKPEDWRSVEVRFGAVYTPDPTNPNSSWARATPSGQLTLSIQNPGAIRGLKQQVEKAETDGRKNGDHPTREFYVDMYAAPATD